MNSTLPEMEKIILKGLMVKEDYAREVAAYIKKEYFETYLSKNLFSYFFDYFTKYNSCPPKDVIILELEKDDHLNEDQFSEGKEMIGDIYGCDIKKYNHDWFKEETEKWCQRRAVINAIYDSVNIIDGSDKKRTTHSIPELMRDALGVSFDASIGHDYIDDRDKRFEYYHDTTEKYPFDLSMFNKITNGGVSRKTLNCILAGTNAGKSQFLCHLATSYIRSGLNVLYVTCEMAEEKIAERIDANLINIPVNDLPKMSALKYKEKTDKEFRKLMGRLVIKEYPAVSANVNHLRLLLQELKTKKNFMPDVLIVDYINIMASARFSGNSNANSYTIVKAIAEELRGLAQEENLVLWSATQANREGIDSSDLSLNNTSESIGLPQTADLMVGMVVNEELEARKQALFIQLKNRYHEKEPRKFIVGIDRPYSRFYNVDDKAQSNLSGSEEYGSGYGSEHGATKDKFDGVNFDD